LSFTVFQKIGYVNIKQFVNEANAYACFCGTISQLLNGYTATGTIYDTGQNIILINPVTTILTVVNATANGPNNLVTGPINSGPINLASQGQFVDVQYTVTQLFTQANFLQGASISQQKAQQTMQGASQFLIIEMGSNSSVAGFKYPGFTTLIQQNSLPTSYFAPALYNATTTSSQINVLPVSPPFYPSAANPSPTPATVSSGLSLGGKIAIGIVFGLLGAGLIGGGVYYYYKQSQPLPAEMTVFKVGGDKGNANQRGATFEMSTVESNPVVAQSTSRI